MVSAQVIKAAGVDFNAGGGVYGSKMITDFQTSQEIRKRKHFKIIDEIARELNIPNYIRDQGHRFHQIAATTLSRRNQSRHRTMGRDTKVVAAACLYMACRIN